MSLTAKGSGTERKRAALAGLCKERRGRGGEVVQEVGEEDRHIEMERASQTPGEAETEAKETGMGWRGKPRETEMGGDRQSLGKRHEQREIRMERRQGKTKIETQREIGRAGAAWNGSLSYNPHLHRRPPQLTRVTPAPSQGS